MQTRQVRLFVASPGDVKPERDQLKRVVDELNTTVGLYKKLQLELIRWETHCNPGMGRAQGLINEQIGEYDIFLGVMWRRFGTPTGKADSGTEEEFRKALQLWENDRTVQVLFYFSQAPFTPRTQDELDQFSKVLKFRAELEKLGLVWEYGGATDFSDVVRPHLTRIALNFGEPETPAAEAPKRAAGTRVFVASSVEGLPLAKRVKDSLAQVGVEALIWSEAFSAGTSILGALDEILATCSASVMILTDDDAVMARGHQRKVPRDNLIYELGLFHGRHGRNRTFVLAPASVTLPTDLSGLVYLRMDPERMEPAIHQLQRALSALKTGSSGFRVGSSWSPGGLVRRTWKPPPRAGRTCCTDAKSLIANGFHPSGRQGYLG
jgi:predicted nucleotide-binding protein